MPSATPRDSLSPTADDNLQATLTFGAQQLAVRVLKIDQGTVDLVVPRTLRVVVGDLLTIHLEGDGTLEGLVVNAVCDTRRLRKASDEPWLDEAPAEGEEDSLWVRCAAE